MRRIFVSDDVLDPASLQGALEGLGGGAVATFTGLVRGDDGLATLRLDHYPAMTERQLGRIVDAALQRWPLLGVIVAHRVGDMVPGDRIVFVGTAGRHRGEALDACAFLIDWLKTSAPFWKLETGGDGTRRWIEPRQSDDDALSRWKERGQDQDQG